MAFHDNVYVFTSPERVGPVEESVELELREHARIRVNQGKTQVWNRCGDRPPNCEHLFNTDGELNDAWWGDHDLPRISYKQSSPRRLVNTEPSWRESGRSLICSAHGSCDAGIRQCLEDLLHTPVTNRGEGFAECSANQIHSILGKLGRRRPNDPLASPRSCGSHRVVPVQRSGRFSWKALLRPEFSF